MYQFKGFVEIKQLVNNSVGVVAPIGELSAIGKTYAKDVKVYSVTAGETQVNGFSSKSSTSGIIAAPSVITTRAVEIAEWVAVRQRGLGAVESTADFKTAYTAQFGSVCSNLDVGAMVTATNGKVYPAWVTWTNNEYVADSNLNKLWFSDAAFRQQYDEYEVVVVPPLPNLDSLFGTFSDVVQVIVNRTWTQSLDLINTFRNNYPETILTAGTFALVNPLNTNQYQNTNWSYLIYGPRGNDQDVLKQATIDYIYANSTRPLTQWKNILPDIFKSTEFILVPNWSQYAIQELALVSGIYSPIVNIKRQVAQLKTVIPGYSAAHIETNCSVMPHPYKSMLIGVIGNIDNRGGKYSLLDMFPDIINVSSTSADYGRMSQLTQGFLNHLATMLPLAEKMTSDTEIPSEYRKATRDGVLYLSVTYNNAVFMVATKATTPGF